MKDKKNNCQCECEPCTHVDVTKKSSPGAEERIYNALNTAEKSAIKQAQIRNGTDHR